MREKKRGSTCSALDRCTTRCKRERQRLANGRPTFRHAHFRSEFDCDSLQVIFSNCCIAFIPCAQCHLLNHCSTVCR